MKTIATTVVAVVVVLSAASADYVEIHFKNGEVNTALFILMKRDTVYLEVADTTGNMVKRAYRKSLFSSITFENGRRLDLSKSNSPPELNQREAYLDRNKSAEFVHER